MKFAICFYGQPRCIDNNLVYERYLELIKKYDTDVFIHSWISDKNEKFLTSDWSKKYELIEKENSSSQILSMYNPKKYLFEKPKQFKLKENIKEKVKHLEYYSENNENNLLSHLTSFTESVKLVENIDYYDFILITRLDVYLIQFPNLIDLQKNKIYLVGNSYRGRWVDGVILLDSKFIKDFYVTENIEDLSNHISLFTSETYTEKNFLKNRNGSDISWLDNLEVAYVRTNDGLKVIQQ